MAARDMAGVAHSRHPHFQQLRVVRTVRLVAIRAILHHGRVFPEERSAALRVAAQAILVCGRLNELLWIRTAVRIVATRARDLSFAIRHVRRAL